MQKHKGSILIIDDDNDVLIAARVVLRQKFETVITENNPQKINHHLQHNQYDVILLDMNFSSSVTTGNEGLFWLKQIRRLRPEQHVVMITAYGDIQLAVEAMKLGAADFVVKPWENEKLEATVVASFHHVQSRKEISQLKNRQAQLSRMISVPETEMIGNSPAMKEVMKAVNKVAGTEANILLLGENGTGKELIAKYIHNQSSRKDLPFVKVDLGALTSSLFESELFGHKKGSFTDAKEDRAGRFELANGGTLFLDEIGNLPLPMQVKLLSVLQNREIMPIGSNMPIPIDVRLISATNMDIHSAIESAHFREDLLYRINTVEITLPPLRDRADDIPLLANHFLKFYTTKYRKENKSISAGAMHYLQQYAWPGNVRELQHAIERAVIMSDEHELQKNNFLFSGKKASQEKKETLSLDEMERKAIMLSIQKHHGNMSKVAKELGLGRTTLYRKMTKYGLQK